MREIERGREKEVGERERGRGERKEEGEREREREGFKVIEIEE